MILLSVGSLDSVAKRQGTGFTAEQRVWLTRLVRRITSEPGKPESGKLTQSELADKIGADKASINKLRAGKAGLNPEYAMKLCKEAGVDFEVLMETGEERPIRPSVADLPEYAALRESLGDTYAGPVWGSVVGVLDAIGVGFVSEPMVTAVVEFRQRILRMKPDEELPPLERIAAAQQPRLRRAKGT